MALSTAWPAATTPSHWFLSGSGSSGAGTVLVGSVDANAGDTRTSAEPALSTRSTRRGLSFTLRLRKVSCAPLALSRTVRLNRSALAKP
ncbi:hypothetical protein [Rhodanobacter lindaniclasticus]